MTRPARSARSRPRRHDAIVVTGAGLPQGDGQAGLGHPAAADAHRRRGGFSTMGFTVPAAIGARLARPERQVVGDRRRRRLPADDAGACDRGDARPAGLHGRPRQLGLDQHQGRPARLLRADRGVDRLPPPDGSSPTRPTTGRSARRSASTAEHVERPDEVRAAVERALAPAGPRWSTSRWPAPSTGRAGQDRLVGRARPGARAGSMPPKPRERRRNSTDEDRADRSRADRPVACPAAPRNPGCGRGRRRRRAPGPGGRGRLRHGRSGGPDDRRRPGSVGRCRHRRRDRRPGRASSATRSGAASRRSARSRWRETSATRSPLPARSSGAVSRSSSASSGGSTRRIARPAG